MKLIYDLRFTIYALVLLITCTFQPATCNAQLSFPQPQSILPAPILLLPGTNAVFALGSTNAAYLYRDRGCFVLASAWTLGLTNQTLNASLLVNFFYAPDNTDFLTQTTNGPSPWTIALSNTNLTQAGDFIPPDRLDNVKWFGTYSISNTYTNPIYLSNIVVEIQP